MQDTTVDTPPRLPLLLLFQQVLSVQLVITVKQVLEHLKHVLLEPIILILERLHQLTVLIVWQVTDVIRKERPLKLLIVLPGITVRDSLYFRSLVKKGIDVLKEKIIRNYVHLGSISL